MNSKKKKKTTHYINNESEQKMKLTHRIHVCVIIFQFIYFDVMNSLKSDKMHQTLTQ